MLHMFFVMEYVTYVDEEVLATCIDHHPFLLFLVGITNQNGLYQNGLTTICFKHLHTISQIQIS